jgi:hypothetical protein
MAKYAPPPSAALTVYETHHFFAIDCVWVIVYRISHLRCVTRSVRQTGILIRGNFGGIKSRLLIAADEMRLLQRERLSLRISA